jgi:hypothetical protein
VTQRFQPPFNLLFNQPFGANTTFDFDNGPIQQCALTGNINITFANIQAGMVYVLYLQQDATGNRIATWPGNARFGTESSVLSTAAGAIDLFICYARSGQLFILPMKGY